MYTAPSIYKMGKHACIPVKLLKAGIVKKRSAGKRKTLKIGRKKVTKRRKTARKRTTKKVTRKTAGTRRRKRPTKI